MDILPVFIFIMLNLLPADVRECKAYKEDSDTPAFTLKRAGKTWEFLPQEGEKRLFKCSPTKIHEWSEENRKWNAFPVEQFLDKPNWKRATYIRMKEENYNLLIERETKSFSLIRKQAGEDVKLILRY